ncbi:hypothetical protein [Spirosoma litoris]
MNSKIPKFFPKRNLFKSKYGGKGFPGKHKPKEYSREALADELREAPWGRNFFATGIFRIMNWQMQNEGQPITKEHYNVLVHSLTKERKGLLRTLWAENKNVMESEGDTCVYRVGKYGVHWPMSKIKNYWEEE